MSIYLDTASTVKPIDNMTNLIRPYIEEKWYNPSSLYNPSTDIKKKLEEARSLVARLINANTEEIIFSSGASESNNHVIRGFDDVNCQNESMIITTRLEHASILNALKNPALTSVIRFCDVDKNGFVDLQHLKVLLESCKNREVLVSVIYAQNEIGTIQKLKEISDLTHSHNAILHTDCTQALPHIEVDVKELGIDLMTASAHKLGGLKGTGFLYKSKRVELSPLIYGEQENKHRGGTENIVGIIALGKAIKSLNYNRSNEMCKKRDYFIDSLKSKFSKSGFEVKLNGHPTQRLPNNINVTFPQNITGESLLYTLETNGIYIGTGSACNSKEIKPSHVLKAIGLSDEQAMKTVRFTLPEDITYEQIDEVISEIDKALKIIET